jgi:hypothetical protein
VHPFPDSIEEGKWWSDGAPELQVIGLWWNGGRALLSGYRRRNAGVLAWRGGIDLKMPTLSLECDARTLVVVASSGAAAAASGGSRGVAARALEERNRETDKWGP